MVVSTTCRTGSGLHLDRATAPVQEVLPMSVSVRPFRRSDRDQLAALVNAHVAAVVPGISVSVNAVLAQLEREPGEFIVDPWVAERATLVAEQRGRVVAAAHLLRYGAGDDVGRAYRDSGEIRWLLAAVDAPFWPDASDAAAALTTAAVEQLDRWRVAKQHADCSLPAPGVYGIPEQWPHVAALLERAGFRPGRSEVVLLARADDLPREVEAPVPALELRRSLGINGTRLSAVAGGTEAGFVEIDLRAEASAAPRLGGWADVGNFRVAPGLDDEAVGVWLFAQAAGWLRLGGVTRLLDYAEAGEEDAIAFRERLGFRLLTRTQRGWVREPAP
jgi:hypothetical protein